MDAIQREDLESAVENVDSGILTLCSGESVYFESIAFHEEYRKTFSKLADSVRGQVDITEEIDLSDTIVIENREVPPEHWIFIPPENVYNVIPLEFSGGKPPQPRQVSPIPTFRQFAYEDSIHTAMKSNKCHLEPMYTTQNIDAEGREISPQPVDFEQNEPLYADWEFFERASDGITGIGAGAFGFSFSTSWDADLKARFAESLGSNRCAFTELESESEATVVGQVDFIEQESGVVTEEMEGEEWVLGVVSKEVVKSIEDTKKTDFVPGYFKRSAFLFPEGSWDYIQNDLHVYGDVLESPIKLGSIEVQQVIKVRSVGYVDEPSVYE